MSSDTARRSFGHLVTGADNPDLLRGVGPDKPATPPPAESETRRSTGLDWAAISPPRTGPDPFTAAADRRAEKAEADQSGRFTTPTAPPPRNGNHHDD